MTVGVPLARHLLEQVHETINYNDGLDPPRVVIITVGKNSAALTYSDATQAAAALCGVQLYTSSFLEDVDDKTVQEEVRSLNGNPMVHGIILQLPLPAHLDAALLMSGIKPVKDIDGLNPYNVSLFARHSSEAVLSPCIAVACEEVLRQVSALPTLAAPHARVLMLGVPLSAEFAIEIALRAAGCRVASCRADAQSDDAIAQIRIADVILIGIAQPAIVNASSVKDGCLILDLGLSRHSPPSTPVDAMEDDGAHHLAKGVRCLCCSDGLADITAAFRIRNASTAALLIQGFIDCKQDLYVDDRTVALAK
mmetsp:Transcript_7782/g.15275  ORF Transcript_7782/g.15275 Transcript_7782/m.15275 type:complete len:309 (-) Transcript_7782:650-1576(-)